MSAAISIEPTVGLRSSAQRIERLSQAALALIAESDTLSRHPANLRAAKGVGVATALAVLGELSVLPQDLKAPQVSRFAGLDVRLTQSGTSVNRPGRLSKAGNAYLRSALYMPALSAVRHDPRAKAFYDALVSRGKKKIQAPVCRDEEVPHGLVGLYPDGNRFRLNTALQRRAHESLTRNRVSTSATF